MTTQHFQIDTSHSGVHFTVRHMVIAKVRGSFNRWHGTIDFDEANPSESKVSVSIEAASVDTRESKRDEHLRSADFFDVAHHPALTFESTRVEQIDGARYRVLGDLTLRGVTRPVALEAELLGRGKDPWGNQRLAFEARTSIHRKEFGLTWNQALEAGGLLVGETVEIALDVEAILAAAEKAA